MSAEVQSYVSTRAAAAKSAIVPLQEMLPLDTPLSLLIDPSNICNFSCIFCPTGDSDLLASVDRPKGLMGLDLFNKIMDDLDDFPRSIRAVSIYKDGEPLANPKLAQMIASAKQSGKIDRIEITTNGALLKLKRGQEIIEAGLDGLRVSVYGLNDDEYKNITTKNTKFEAIRGNVEALYQWKQDNHPDFHIHCKIVDVDMSEEQKNFFADTFSPISDSIHIDTLMGWSNTSDRDMTLGNDVKTGISGASLKVDRQVCSEPFMKLCINHDGSVSVCCVDWAHATTVGNVNDEKLIDIWHGERLRELRLKHLTGNRSDIKACDGCQYIQGLPEYSNLDDSISKLLPIYEESSYRRCG